jgi:prepilin-type N-terminal cleavage/methylation domain-containing protein
MRHARGRRGYTLIEMMVTVILIGILASFGVPQYLKTVETSKADDAVALVNMVGTTNKMFALDHSNTYVVATLNAAGCGAGTCPTTGPYTNGCHLVWCKYLADQNFAAKGYDIYACNGNTATSCGGMGAGNFVAGVRRKASAASPYNTWGYTMNTSGTITAYGTEVPAPTY